MLAAFGKSGLPPEQWADALLESASQLKALEERLVALSNDEPEIAALLQAAGERIAAGDFEGADARLADAETRDLAAGQARVTRAATSRSRRAELARDLKQYWVAGEHFEAAADMVDGHDRVQAAHWRVWAGLAFNDHGLLFPGPGMARAIAAYRSALEVYTRADMPAQWATTQNNLGNALTTLGQRAGGEAGVSSLQDAVTAYRSALEVRTRADMPADWAATQENMS